MIPPPTPRRPAINPDITPVNKKIIIKLVNFLLIVSFLL